MPSDWQLGTSLRSDSRCSFFQRMRHFITLLVFAASTFAADAGYLFVTFKGEQNPMGEQIYFAVSRDGKNWEALNKGDPVLVSQLGEKGVRDPYLLRAKDGKRFYLIATDLSIFLNRDWKRAVQAGSRSIVIWESEDLVKWSEPRLVAVAPEDAGCTWAPEAIYDESSGDYLVFWASTTKAENFQKHRIWAARTKDFRQFSAPFVYIEKPNTIIDTTIVQEGGKYYRFTKDEKDKAITMEVSDSITGQWTDVPTFSLAKMRGYEGPQCYVVARAANGQPATWCLILDHYAQRKGYEPFVTANLSTGEFTPGTGFTFPFRFRHGSVLPLSEQELARLEKAYK
jgi:hypothetical protein